MVARGLRKRYGDHVAVDGIDLAVRAGECFGLLGPNGAGKSTTMKMICGLAAVGGGELTVLGHDVARRPREVKRRIGVVPQEDNLDRDLTVRELLRVQAWLHGIRGARAERRVDELVELAGLASRSDACPDELSGGMRRRVLIARALVAEPALVLLDEPTTGLDPAARKSVWEALGALRRGGITLLLTTHYMEEATEMCDRLVFIDRGRVVEEGSPAELVQRHGEATLEAVFLRLTGHGLDEA